MKVVFEITLSLNDSVSCAILKLQPGQLDCDIMPCLVLLLLSESYGSSITLGQFILKMATFLLPPCLNTCLDPYSFDF